ncbi:hypothetical protein [Microcoleus sp. Pol12A6]|uniref:hypothetical protein n=1 Tax=Microcoleus sp. Pol12A6 TaxID=3055393 RepID=UPI002FD40676
MQYFRQQTRFLHGYLTEKGINAIATTFENIDKFCLIVYEETQKLGQHPNLLTPRRAVPFPRPQTATAGPGFPTTQKQVTITLRLMNINKNSQITGTKN